MTLDYERHIFHSPEFRSVVDAALTFFNQTPVHELPPADHFDDCGVYGIYYVGSYELYSNITNANHDSCAQPIYVGKAVPRGWRTARTRQSSGSPLYGRLNEHAKSITQARNLDLADFRCRFMILGGIEADLVVPVEAELIRTYKPLWNSTIDGFGNHDPGSGRYEQAKSEWDVLHPGRPWAEKLTGTSPQQEDVVREVRESYGQLGLF